MRGSTLTVLLCLLTMLAVLGGCSRSYHVGTGFSSHSGYASPSTYHYHSYGTKVVAPQRHHSTYSSYSIGYPGVSYGHHRSYHRGGLYHRHRGYHRYGPRPCY